jgi:GT2 family glycosyltransferase
VDATDADHVVLLNNDTEVLSAQWLGALVEQSHLSDVGAVGCRLLYPDGRAQHEGICIGYAGQPAVNVDYGQWFGLSDSIREVSAVTGACLMVERRIYWDIGGLDEMLGVAYNDVDFCLKLLQQGYRNVYTPLAILRHAEGATRRDLHPSADVARFLERWGDVGDLRDAYLNPAIWTLSPLRLRVPPHVAD